MRCPSRRGQHGAGHRSHPSRTPPVPTGPPARAGHTSPKETQAECSVGPTWVPATPPITPNPPGPPWGLPEPPDPPGPPWGQPEPLRHPNPHPGLTGC